MKCYTISVTGHFSYNDITDRILTFDNTHCSTNTYAFWNSNNLHGEWGNRDPECGYVYGKASFVLGLITKDNYFGFQAHDDSVGAFAKPY